MNSSNDPLDKLLQQRFQQLFSREHTVVDDALKQRIWKRLPPSVPRTHRLVGLLLVGVLLCVSVGLYYGLESVATAPKSAYSSDRQAAGPDSLSLYAVGRHSANHLQPIRAIPSNQDRSLGKLMAAHPLEAIANSLPKPDRRSTEPPGVSLGEPALKALPTKRSDNAILSATAISRRDARKRTGLRPKESELVELVGGRATTRSARLVSNKRKPRRVVPLPAASATGFISSPMSARVENDSNDSLANEPVINWAPLRATRHVAVGSVENPLSTQLSQRVDFLTPLAASARTASRQPTPAVDWFFMAAPFSSYQRMTIIAKTETYVQDVASPAPWSSQTWGYQLSGGVRWWGWDVALSYGQLRRWSYYDRAINAYQVESSGPAAYQVTRQTEAVAENVSLSLVGVGIARTHEWGKHKRYYVRAGAQLSYILPTHQALGWLETSWGLALPLGKQHQIQVGPRLAYSLSDIGSTDGQLRIRPFTAGLSLTIRP